MTRKNENLFILTQKVLYLPDFIKKKNMSQK